MGITLLSMIGLTSCNNEYDTSVELSETEVYSAKLIGSWNLI